MTRNPTLILMAGIALVAGMAPRAAADDWDQRSIITFSGPVEIPGQVLPAGTYVFKLVDSPSDRNIVQVFNKAEDHLYGTFLAVPDYRLRPPGKTLITFEERAADSPEAVKAWFFPGESYGHQFVYPKLKALALAKANRVPVPSMPAELAQNTTKPTQSVQEPHIVAMAQAPLMVQQPDQLEVEIAQMFPPQVPQPPADRLAVASTNAPPTLPLTGNSFPWVGAVGLSFLLSAGFLRLANGSK